MTTTTTDIEHWFDANGPENPIETCALHDAFENLSDEGLYRATKNNLGAIFVTGSIEPETLVLPSIKSQNFFRRTLEACKNDKELDFDEERDFYVSVNNPKS